MIDILKNIIIAVIIFCSFNSYAEILRSKSDEVLVTKVSKTGINRIANPPYRIVQVTGDESKFRLKYDLDGENIYLMPLCNLGESIEISLKNNAGFVQDLELKVSSIKGKSIIIDNSPKDPNQSREMLDIAEMLKAMKNNKDNNKFYVQSINIQLGDIDNLKIKQTKTYKYKNIIGGIFEVSNEADNQVILDVPKFAENFENVKSSYPNSLIIEPKQTLTMLIVQKKLEK